ncbi:MAG: MFS transporter [Candidatus Hydrogenedentales bacterium]
MTEATSQPRNLLHNTVIYFSAFGVLAFTIAFADMTVLIPNLTRDLKAPSWVAMFPSVAASSVGYLPVVLMGWVLRPGTSKKMAYGLLSVPLYGSLMVLGLSLCLTRDESILRNMILLATLVNALFVGTTVLPFWDMLHRSIPESVRGRIMGSCTSVTMVVGLLAANVVAWLIGSGSPLPWPANYGAGLILAGLGGYLAVFLLLLWRQSPAESAPDEARRSFRRFGHDLLGILRTDKSYGRFLVAAACIATVAGVGTMLLMYAKNERGFTNDHVALLIRIRPVVGFFAMMAFGFLADRIGARRVCSINAIILLAAIVMTPFVHGAGQLFPQLLAGFGGFIYSFVLMEILNYSPKGRNQDYLSVYYLTAMIPGLVPMGLGRLMDVSASLGLGIACALTVVAAVLFALPVQNRSAALD